MAHAYWRKKEKYKESIGDVLTMFLAQDACAAYARGGGVEIGNGRTGGRDRLNQSLGLSPSKEGKFILGILLCGDETPSQHPRPRA